MLIRAKVAAMELMKVALSRVKVLVLLVLSEM